MSVEIEAIKTIYNHLGDKESKYIFEKRLIFSLIEDYSLIKDIVNTTKEGNAFLKALYAPASGEKLIFGIGWWGKNIVKTYPDISFEGFVDNNIKKRECLGLPVFSFEQYLESYKKSTIIISSRLYYKEIFKQLIENGIKEENIINFGQLEDALTKYAYFNLPALEKTRTNREFFIDAGAFDGMTSKAFIEWAKSNYIGLYAFEPDEVNAKKVHSALDEYLLNKSGGIIEKGLWNKTMTLHFLEGEGALSRIVETGDINVSTKTELFKTIELPVCSIDGICKDEKISFIKMDIEGSEYEALCGAEKTIKKNKPKLAISIYHKPEDIWKLPKVILDINPDYTLYLRHYSLAGEDTVLYAVSDNKI